MKKLLLLLILPLFLQAQYSGFNVEATALIARMTPAPSTLRSVHIDSIISRLKSNGLWARTDELLAIAAHNVQAAKLNWITGTYGNATSTGTVTFVRDVGIKSDGTTGYWNLNYNPTDDGSAYTLNYATHAIWFEGVGDVNVNTILGSNNGSGGLSGHYIGSGTTGNRVYVNSLTQRAVYTQSIDSFRASIRNVSLLGARQNGTWTAPSAVSAPTSMPTIDFFALALNSSGSPANFVQSDSYLRFVWIGDSLNEVESDSLFHIEKDYLEGLPATLTDPSTDQDGYRKNKLYPLFPRYK